MIAKLTPYRFPLALVMLCSISLHTAVVFAQETARDVVEYPIYSPDFASLDPEEIYQRLNSQPLDRLSHEQTIDYLVALIRNDEYKKARFVIDDALKRT